jgi:chondroitin-sulfate-ABC endolyase/exolyase
MKKALFLLLATAVPATWAALPMAGTSFENSTDLDHFAGSGLGVVSNHMQFGAHALEWNHGAGGVLEISDIRPLAPEQSGSKYGAHFPLSPTFVMSLYNEKRSEKALRIEFNGKVRFDLGLDFVGWRTVWVPFHEMQGKAPSPGKSYTVKSARFTAPGTEGTLWFDDIVFCQYIDDRHPYPGLEVPFIKGGGAHVSDHWMPKIPHGELLDALEIKPASPQELRDLVTVGDRLWSAYYKRPGKPRGLGRFSDEFKAMGILPTAGKTRPLKQDKQVDPVRYDQALGADPEYLELRPFGEAMLKLANEYLSTTDADARDALARLFAYGAAFYLNQGWAAGSSQGTAHHIGYSTRELHTAFFLAKDALAKYGLLDAVGKAVRWQLNFGEMLDPGHLESNLDYYNTQSVFRLMSAFLSEDPSVRAAYLRVYSSHLSSALALTSSQGFRPDGTAWHHFGHYPAYATGALDRVPVSLKALAGTSFRIGEAGHANFRRAFLAATLYSNPQYWGIGQAGRHPLGGNIGKLKEACLSLAMSTAPIDAEVAATYVRLWGHPPGNLFAGLELDPSPPTGHWSFPYAALSVHRRADWSVNIKGYSKYVWASEIYQLDNRYGRYQSNGTVQILPNMPQGRAGYAEDGWDWNHPPGATTVGLPFKELEPKEPLVMFKSVESFAGGCALDGNGVWAMKLNEANGFSIDPVKTKMGFPNKLKARKSVFCFGDQLLCLGSGIEARGRDEVHTTLFQAATTPETPTAYNDAGLLLDPAGNGYKVLSDSFVVVTDAEQASPNNKYSLRAGAGKPGASARASGFFSKAWINHGKAPRKGAYAYAVFPQVGTPDLQALEKRIAELPALGILRQDNRAHIVEEAGSGTTAYACFESGSIGAGLLESVSVPCHVMLRQGDTLGVSVANPDLNQEEDPVKGHYNGDSKEAPVTLKLAGRWKIKGTAAAWTEADGDSTLLTVKCIDGKSMEIELEESNDQALFEQAKALDWKPLFKSNGSKDWNIDGEFATVEDSPGGMEFSAGPEEWNHAHHAVLWTKDSFAGDVKIEYDYTRLDDVNKWVNILYIQATGKGGDFPPDIMEWADYRTEPWMKHYFENMKLLHVSYAAYDGVDGLGADDDYVRCRRYPKAEKGGFSKTEIKPDFFRTGLFRTGKTYHITAIKKGDRLFFNVEGKGREKLFAWQSPLIGEVTEGRVGLRHMWMKSAHYENFTVSVLEGSHESGL